jgi:hypothetical protein
VIMNDGVGVELPGGYWFDGICHRQAGLRPLTGEDEAFLLETGHSLLPAQRITALLARCVTHLGPLKPVAANAVRELSIGDREALLLHLRRLTWGDRMQGVVNCPHPDCGEKMDLELKVNDLLVRSSSSPPAFHETTAMEPNTSYRVRFRVPTGADQETVAGLARDDPQAAADLLLRRCVEWVLNENSQLVDEIPSTVASHLAELMAELDPQAELVLNLTCPNCGHTFSTIFDAASYFFQEVAARTRYLYREVHLLAFHYHWSEAEILAMTGQKGRLYLDLLAEAFSEERCR